MSRRVFVPVSAASDQAPQNGLLVTLSPKQRCPYCHQAIEAHEELVACLGCQTVQHAACGAEEGKCTTLGCEHGPPPAVVVQAVGEPAGCVPPPAGQTAPARRRWKGVLGLIAFSFPLGLLGGYLLADQPEQVTYPPVVSPPPSEFAVRLDLPRADQRLQLDASGTVQVHGGGYITPWAGQLAVFVNGVRAQIPKGVCRVGERPGAFYFSAEVPLSAGWQMLDVTAQAGGLVTSSQLRVWVSEPPQPVATPSFLTFTTPAETIDALAQFTLPATTRTNTVWLRGQIASELGTVRISVSGPTGALSYEAPPGPFESMLSLPGPGTHEVTVTVSDARGRSASERRFVQRVP